MTCRCINLGNMNATLLTFGQPSETKAERGLSGRHAWQEEVKNNLTFKECWPVNNLSLKMILRRTTSHILFWRNQMPPMKYWPFAMHLLDQADDSESQTPKLDSRRWIPCSISESSSARPIRNLALSCQIQVLRVFYPARQMSLSSFQQDLLHPVLMGLIQFPKELCQAQLYFPWVCRPAWVPHGPMWAALMGCGDTLQHQLEQQQ